MPDFSQLLQQLGAALAFFAVVGWIVATFFVWLSARICGVPKASFGRAMLATLAETAVSFLGSVFFGLFALPWVGTLLGILLSVLILKGVFETGFGRALAVWALSLASSLLVLLLALFALGALVAAAG